MEPPISLAKRLTNSTYHMSDKNESSSASADPKSDVHTAEEDAANRDGDGNQQQQKEGPSEGDLIIRDGFPALHTPGSTLFQPNLKDPEAIPQHTFWCHDTAIHFAPQHLETLRSDCETVFTARDKPDGAAYSAGQTFFLPFDKAPRCALEAMAKLIFEKHTAHLPAGTFHPSTSGANWWTLVMDDNDDNHDEDNGGVAITANKMTGGDDSSDAEEEDDDDEVGLHFDADYELEEQTTNILLHPRVATVTYLSDCGAPTAIFNLKSPPMDDVERKCLEQPIDKAWLSHPRVGKHTAFDGRLLHGAPALYFPKLPHGNSQAKTEEDPPAKRQKVEGSAATSTNNCKRYTLLVNVWLNHWVMDAALLDDEVCAQLKTPWEDPSKSSNLKMDDSFLPPFVWNDQVDLSKPYEISPANTVQLKLSTVDPAGEDEITMCNHHVTVKYNPLMEECHAASRQASTVKLELGPNAIHLKVGSVLEDEEEEEHDCT